MDERGKPGTEKINSSCLQNVDKKGTSQNTGGVRFQTTPNGASKDRPFDIKGHIWRVFAVYIYSLLELRPGPNPGDRLRDSSPKGERLHVAKSIQVADDHATGERDAHLDKKPSDQKSNDTRLLSGSASGGSYGQRHLRRSSRFRTIDAVIFMMDISQSD